MGQPEESPANPPHSQNAGGSFRRFPVSPTEWSVLAALRFCFAVGVFSQHIASYAPDGVSRTLRALGGFPGVAGFLILSGFSIRASYESQPRGYLLRRALRIFPIYLIGMVLACVPYAFFGTGFTSTDPVPCPTIWDWLGNAFMLAQFVPLPFPANGPLWTVQVEFTLYLLAPWLARRGDRVVLVLIAFSATIYAAFPHVHGRVALHTVSHGISLLVMAWIWLLGWYLHAGRGSRRLTVAAILFVGAMFWHWQGDSRFGIARMSPPLLAVTAVAVAHYIPDPGQTARAIMNWLGDVSYEIYAFHVPLLILLFTWTQSISSYHYVLLVLVVSALVLHSVDRPIRGLGRKTHPRVEPGTLTGGAVTCCERSQDL